MMTATNPIWWDASHDSAWNYVKLVMKRGLRSKQAGDTDTIPTSRDMLSTHS